MDEATQTVGGARQISDREDFINRVCERMKENTTPDIYIPDAQVTPPPDPHIPQRPFCEGLVIPADVTPRTISFMMADGKPPQASLALAGECFSLVDGNSTTLIEQVKVKTIALRILWPGYDGWTGQIRTVDYQVEPKSITLARLLMDIAKQLNKFIEHKQSVVIDPAYARYKVGPDGIQLHHMYITSLEQVSKGSWQAHIISNVP